METFDCVVIGSGPGGYVAAILAGKRGMKTLLIEKYPVLGGACLNVGCVPSKTLLDTAEKFWQAKTHLSDVGVELQGLKCNWEKMQKHKQKVVSDNNKGIEFLLKKNKVEKRHGTAELQPGKKILIKESKQIIEAKNIILATGSKPSSIPGVTLDKNKIISSTEALSLNKVPKSMIVIGGGVIGLELGSVYRRLGTKLVVVEFMDRLLSNFDASISKDMLTYLKKQGLEFYLQQKVQQVKVQKDQVHLTAVDPQGKELQLNADYALVATGRRPYTEGLGLDNVNIDVDQRGFIVVDKNLQTSVAGIYAIGDVIGGLMLAHKAEEEAAFVIEHLQGEKPHINYSLIPSVVYTWPEVASVGKTEEECKKAGLAVKIGTFPFMALARARASNDTDGWVKIIADKATDEVLGCHIIGARAVDLIMELTVAMEYRASAEDIARISHPHPAFCESVKEAALQAWGKKAIHI